MSDTSKIEWTDATWSPVTGCTKISQGCKHCYAERDWQRLSANAATVYYGRKFTDVQCHIDRLEQPLRWRKPRRIFVNSMSDLFHESVPDRFIAGVFATIAATPWHTYQVLTKRPQRALVLLGSGCMGGFEDTIEESMALITDSDLIWPIPNLWLGVSVEDQAAAEERIPLLLQTPAAVRWISAEPCLGSVDVRAWLSLKTRAREDNPSIQWVVVGGESGPGARSCRVAHVRAIVHQCRAAGVPVFVKQLGANVVDRNDAGFDGCDPSGWPDMDPFNIEDNIHGYKEEYQGADVRVRLFSHKGSAMREWPEDLRVREYPT